MTQVQTCQWVGPDQDPARHSPMKMCGHRVLEGKSYCKEHYPQVYQVGTGRKPRSASCGKKTTDVLNHDDIIDLMNEAIAELEAEGVL